MIKAAIENETTVEYAMCHNLSETAKAEAYTQWEELLTYGYVSYCSLSSNFTSSLQCNSSIVDLFENCLKPIMGISKTYTADENAESDKYRDWSLIEEITWPGDTTTAPVGADWTISEPLRVLVTLELPWGEVVKDYGNGTMELEGFLPTVWKALTKATDIVYVGSCLIFDCLNKSYNKK